MRISVFGLGYVGTVSAACFARDGHEVIGVDAVRTKIELINAGQPPIIEAEIGDIVLGAVKSGRLRATDDADHAICNTDLSFVCVGTPSQPNGNLDLTYIRRVCEMIAGVIRRKRVRHTVVIRSTILPGTMRQIVIPILEEYSGKRAGIEFGVCNNPEFLREGTAVEDFDAPPKTVIGEFDPQSGDMLAVLYGKIEAPLIRTDIETAEMVKYVDNCWHALKIGFANEIGNLCKGLGVDSHDVMDIFCRDEKLNLSSYYLKPGFAFGGSCLPKDVRALQYRAKEIDVDLPVISQILTSNRLQIQRAFDEILDTGRKKIGLLGFSFKAGTDDLRESPMVILAEHLLGKGLSLRIYDTNVSFARLVCANKEYVEQQIPHLASLLCTTVDEVIDHADVLVIGTQSPEFVGALTRARRHQIIVDLVRLPIVGSLLEAEYRGLCW